MLKPDSVIRIGTTLDSFFTQWLIFLRPYHKLTDRQISLAAQFLKMRYELSKVIKDEKLLDENVMGSPIRAKIREACNVTPEFFQVLVSDLRKHQFFVDGKINPRYIPNLSESPEGYSLMLYFQFPK